MHTSKFKMFLKIINTFLHFHVLHVLWEWCFWCILSQAYAWQLFIYALFQFIHLFHFYFFFQNAPTVLEAQWQCRMKYPATRWACWGRGTADTVISRGIKPHGDSQQCRQSLPRTPSPIAHSNQDTDLRTQTHECSLMHFDPCSQAKCSFLTPYSWMCCKTSLIKGIEMDLD